MSTLVFPHSAPTEFGAQPDYLPHDYEPMEVDESILGDFCALPPEVLEQIMSQMSPTSLLPLMLSNAIFYGLGNSERIWDAVYARHLPCAHKALHLAANPEVWRFDMPSAIRFVYEYAQHHEAHIETPDAEVLHVMSTMHHHAGSPLVQQAAVYIVRRLAYYPLGCDSAYRERVEHFRSLMGEQQVIEALLRVIFLYPDSIALLSGALCAIGNVVIDSTNCKRLVDMAGLKLILAALKRHPDSATIIDFGCFAICNLAEELESRALLLEDGFVDYALDLLSKSERPEAELQPPLDLITTSLQAIEAKEAAGRRVLEALRGLFARPDLSSDLLMHLFTALVVTMEGNDVNRDYALELGLDAPARHFVAQYPNATGLFVKGTLCLFTLYWRRPEPEMGERRLALIDSICTAMRMFADNVEVQRTCAAMLSDLAHDNGELKQRIVSLGGKQLVERAMTLQSPGDDPQAAAEWRIFAQFIRID